MSTKSIIKDTFDIKDEDTADRFLDAIEKSKHTLEERKEVLIDYLFLDDVDKIKEYLPIESIQNPIIKNRITKEKYYLDIAAAVAQRSTCLRRKYGCVIVKNDEIISTGYNGSARGEENCCDKGMCWREANGIPHGEQYEKCVAVHAEQNAIISAPRSEMMGATAFLAGFEGDTIIEAKPCLICERMLKNAGITKIIGTK